MKVFNERILNGGIQKQYKFDNGYGASVVRHNGSFGNKEGLWELAVLKWNDKGKYNLDYSTGITDDVIGYLNGQEIDAILKRIEALEK